MAPIINIKNVSKSYRLYKTPSDKLKEICHPFAKKYHREFRALHDISFKIDKGESIGIIGRNGSGKSTLLKILCGVLQPTSGLVQVNGRVSALLELGAGFNADYTGRQNVYMNGALMGLAKEEIDEKFESIIEFADIGDFLEQPVNTYSSGMYMRLAFACAVNVEPDILVVDEALAVGDVFFRQKCYAKLEEFRKRGITIILVTHAMNEVEQYCQRAVFLDNGSVFFEGESVEAVKRYYLAEQKEHEAAYQISGAQQVAAAQLEGQGLAAGNAEFLWPSKEAYYDISQTTQISNGWARCTAVALCNSKGEPCRSFQQGEEASFFYEFEVLRDIEVPIGGILISNSKNIHVHGKSTLEYGTDVPKLVPKGSKLRFRHDITLELDVDEYTFEAGFALIKGSDYERGFTYTHERINEKITRVCHVPGAGKFAVLYRKEGRPVQRLHYGICNLAGNVILNVQ